jgi:hypothetical protein
VPIHGPKRLSKPDSRPGKRPRGSDEVAQLYVHAVTSSVTTPMRALRGFHRIHLDPGQTGTVSFHLKPEDLAVFDQKSRWIVEPGKFELMVRGASDDIQGTTQSSPARCRSGDGKRECCFNKPVDSSGARSPKYLRRQGLVRKQSFECPSSAQARSGCARPPNLRMRSLLPLALDLPGRNHHDIGTQAGERDCWFDHFRCDA